MERAFSTGYLTDIGEADGGYHRLIIPNKEVLGIYEKKIRSWFKIKIISDTANWKSSAWPSEMGKPR